MEEFDAPQEHGVKQMRETIGRKDDAIKKLEDLEQSLMSMQQSNSEEAQIENIETLREILENLITLSFNQEELISITQKTKTTNVYMYTSCI